MRPRFLLLAAGLLALTAACGPGAAEPEPEHEHEPEPQPGNGSQEEVTGLPGPAPNDLEAAEDLLILARILEGDLDPGEGLHAIAHGGGLPIATEDGFLFARLDDGAGPYRLAGDHNGWSPDAMTGEGGLYWTVAAVASPIGAKYKFVDPSGTHHADPLARRFGYDAFGEHALVRAEGGHLERMPAVAGHGLLPRHVRVWVPAGAPTHHLYVQDGQNLFDPGAFHGGWRLHEVLGETTLAVGIDNTYRRMDEYTHVEDVIGGEFVGGAADAYADLVVGTVLSLVEGRYGAPERRGIMGSSLGGLVSFHVNRRHPDTFDFVASLSGTFGWGRIGAANETLIEAYAEGRPGPAAIYLDSGGGPGEGCLAYGGGSDNYCVNRQMADTLAETGYAWTVDLWHWHEPGATHDEAAWAARVHRPVGLFEGL
jgi:hypothetical protein